MRRPGTSAHSGAHVNSEADPSATVHIDRFYAQKEHLRELLDAIGDTHSSLRDLPGFLRDLIVIRTATQWAVEIVTIVEWGSSRAMEDARQAVRDLASVRYLSMQSLTPRLCAQVGRGDYRPLNPNPP